MWKTPDGQKPDDYILPSKPVDFCVKGSKFQDNYNSIEIETGKWYFTASGTMTKIVMNTKSMYKETTTYIDLYDRTYTYMGKCSNGEKLEPHLDIIAEIPEKLRYWLLQTTKSYHSGGITRVLIDNE